MGPYRAIAKFAPAIVIHLMDAGPLSRRYWLNRRESTDDDRARRVSLRIAIRRALFGRRVGDMRALLNLAIALGVGGGLFILLLYLEASTPGLDLGPTKYGLPIVLGTGLFAGLNARARNRRLPVASDARKTELLGFPQRDGCGWVVVMRDKATVASALGFDVSIDDRLVTQLMPKRFTMVALPAGKHRLFAEVAGPTGDPAVAPKEVMVAAGTVVIFAIRASMGLTRTSLRLEPVADTSSARTTLARLALAEPE
jgi:hypothetical protein